jgi:hypothetical protein
VFNLLQLLPFLLSMLGVRAACNSIKCWISLVAHRGPVFGRLPVHGDGANNVPRHDSPVHTRGTANLVGSSSFGAVQGVSMPVATFLSDQCVDPEMQLRRYWAGKVCCLDSMSAQ